jgi:glycosyltransferase involved in cell wall biosynthesis
MVGDPATPRVLEEADLVYVNTATSIRALRVTGVRPRRVVTHVHELEIGLSHYLSAEDYRLMLDVTDRYVVGPEVARANLVERHGFDPDRIAVAPYFPPRHERVPAGGPSPRERLALGPRTRLVGACGSRDWRKAPDLFAQLAWELGRRDLPDPVHFVWVGDPNPSVPHWDEATDLALLGVEDRVDFVGEQPDPLRWIADFDVFAMTSRDDTFPLVCLEAGSLGVPVVCFESGGIPDLLAASGSGAGIAYLDVTAMADEVEAMLRDEELRRRRGEALRAYVLEQHAVDRCAGLVAAAIEDVLG